MYRNTIRVSVVSIVQILVPIICSYHSWFICCHYYFLNSVLNTCEVWGKLANSYDLHSCSWVVVSAHCQDFVKVNTAEGNIVCLTIVFSSNSFSSSSINTNNTSSSNKTSQFCNRTQPQQQRNFENYILRILSCMHSINRSSSIFNALSELVLEWSSSSSSLCQLGSDTMLLMSKDTVALSLIWQ